MLNFVIFRFLIKAARQLYSSSDTRLAELTEYLGRSQSNEKFCQLSTVDDAIDDNDYIRAFEYVARNRVLAVYRRIETMIADGIASEIAWNRCSIELCKASRVCLSFQLSSK